MAFAGRPTVVLGEVHVIDLRDVGRDHPDGILLLDVGMERIVQKAVVGFVHLSDDVGGIGDRIEHVALEAVQRLDRELDVMSRRVKGGVFMHAHNIGAFGFCRRLAGKDAERLVEWSAQRLPLRGGQTVDRPFEMIKSGGPDGGICADAIAFRVWDDCDCRSPEAIVADRPTNCAEVIRRSFENRKLHPVKACPLDARKQGKVLFGDVRRPQEHVEP